MSDNKYNPQETENRYYKIWEERKYFEIDGNKAIQEEDKNFSIMMPPPNVTGRLHIGHALTFTLQDIITRYKRMDGYKTLWQPGTDHAGIATQNVVEKQLLEQGITKEEIGREAFLEKVWAWKEESAGIMTEQLRHMGVSPAWERERFTMDAGLQKSVKEAFVHLYNEGLIVRGNYMVNWCTHDGALSDIEVEHEEENGKFYHMLYYFADGSGSVEVATTRPETYFGDTAVMVHPDDERYKDIIGKEVKLPLLERTVKIIADEHVDMNFGTGVVKVTPAHDQNDYEVGKRHDLEFITVFDEKGILNDYAGEFKGMERLEAREPIVKRLQEEGYIVKIEDHKHQVGHCYRCKNVVEPYISKQWFVRKEVADKSIEKTNAGEAKFFPPHWINSYNSWMGDLRDWCISRQLWWGHQIPVFYCADCDHEWATGNEHPTECTKCASKNISQDPDVLDTWFSSALWPFSTLGWGHGDTEMDKLFKSEDMKDFYPNSLLITGFDILFFWVARMMMMGEHFNGELPFKHIYLHALVRDEHGQKMSKSKGNVIDPLDMVNKYSADVLRFTLAISAAQGRDIRMSQDKLELNRNFTNKLYNASKFLQMNVETFPDMNGFCVETDLGRYMMSRLNFATKEVRAYLDEYKFNDAALTMYRFLWNEFCDWGIELSKADKASIVELGAIFKEAMKLLHPFMPFITEHLYHELSGTSLENADSIMIKKFPHKTKQRKEEAKFEIIMDAIVSIRRAKVLVDLANQKIAKAYVKIDSLSDKDREMMLPFIARLAKVEEILFTEEKIPNAVSDIADKCETFIPTDSIDLTPIINKLTKQDEKLQKEIGKLGGMLNNERFVANAPEDVLEKNRALLTDAQTKREKVLEQLNSLKA
ncbi:valine--tRNA ligase [Sulfurimonas autotrophica]|uniref:Valine--tRNA ligase n=1 Tax=Sulfurimonas autotrophica (strain ATCC BAA-671 / DSM 16294 / JCM 11897 / OK10) TaxID=563040 RepID=E0UUD3_SULAO|nr:valine--tRNA ligase [Sulfurimonas autotrophica]ADN09508.1 valyl-tRNA synthetase [Sulfurimonas autotrophica DSM 16294]